MKTLASSIQENSKMPGRYSLAIPSITGEKSFLYFTKIERNCATDFSLFDGMNEKLYIELPPETAQAFWDEVKSIGVPVFPTSSSCAKDGFFKEEAA